MPAALTVSRYLANGTYSLLITAPEYLAAIRSVTVDGTNTAIDLGSNRLVAGDTDGNAVIDMEDATLIGANFRIAVPPAPENADLNCDQIVNISDLVLVGSNFGLSGPVNGD